VRISGHPLTPTERRLYHQVHPAKLATDIGADLVGTALLWRRRRIAGIAVGLIPPMLASGMAMNSDLEWIHRSPWGPALRRRMTPGMEGVRLAGFILHAIGAWQRRPEVIAAGWGCIAVGWAGTVAAALRPVPVPAVARLRIAS
jgi:hypothetical protein